MHWVKHPIVASRGKAQEAVHCGRLLQTETGPEKKISKRKVRQWYLPSGECGMCVLSGRLPQFSWEGQDEEDLRDRLPHWY